MNQFPLEEMSCQDELLDVEGAFCLASEGEIYLVYLPAGSTQARLQISQSAPLDVAWFNPRTGGELQQGTLSSILGEGMQLLGHPPADPDLDWVVVIGNP